MIWYFVTMFAQLCRFCKPTRSNWMALVYWLFRSYFKSCASA